MTRDSHRCVVTKLAGPLDAAHVVPPILNNKEERQASFELLKVGWPERIEIWKHHVDNNGTESVDNLLILSPHIHQYYTAGLFGLQPIEASADGKSTKLKLYWLRHRETSGSTMVDIMDIPTLPEDTLKDINIYSKDGHLIKSGEVIELTTSDPINRPLSNWDLLEMQWVLQRLAALAGAVDPEDFGYDDMKEEGSDEGSDGQPDDDVDGRIEEDQSTRVSDWVKAQQIQP